MATTTQLIEQLTAGIVSLTSSEQWRRWLEAQRKFHRYSFGNVLLIMQQCPEATQVAGFHRWLELGRHVRKGEHGIAILAPVTRRVVAEDDAEAETSVVLAGFRPAYVFDVSQTEGEPLPEVASRLTGSDLSGAFERLGALARQLGYTVSVELLPGDRNGDCNHERRRLRVREGLAPAQMVKTLAHELGHAVLHEDTSPERSLAELEAESVAYIVSDGLDLDSSAYSFGYLAGWGGGAEAVPAIKGAAERITAAARQILDHLEDGSGR